MFSIHSLEGSLNQTLRNVCKEQLMTENTRERERESSGSETRLLIWVDHGWTRDR